jgi:hypothetical protein
MTPLEQEFIAVARELIDEFAPEPNAIWVSVSDGPVADPEKPWVVDQSTGLQTPVRIVFFLSTLLNREILQYREGMETKTGEIDAYMYQYSEFEPKLKDYIIWDGRHLKVKSVDAVVPIKEKIIYLLKFGL